MSGQPIILPTVQYIMNEHADVRKESFCQGLAYDVAAAPTPLQHAGLLTILFNIAPVLILLLKKIWCRY